ncbi:c-type cytochrome [Chelatococcus sp. GCM10030263]
MAVALVLAAAAQDGRTAERAPFDAEGDVERGRAVVVGVYAGATPHGERGVGPAGGACFSCHGLNGKGDAAAVVPRLAGQAPAYLYKALKDYAAGARQNAVMTPIAQALTEREMRDVAVYYAAQTGAPYDDPPEVDLELLQHGAMLAAIGSTERGIQGCVNCHGPDGSGIFPSYPSLAGQSASYSEAQLRAWQRGHRKGDPLAVMEMIARRMTDEDVRAVAAFYASIRPRSAEAQTAPGRTSVDALPPAFAPDPASIGRR